MDHPSSSSNFFTTVGYDNSEDSVTEYETSTTTTFTLSVDSKPSKNPKEKRVIPADYDRLIGDLNIPHYSDNSPPYFLKKQKLAVSEYEAICSGLSVSDANKLQ